uniref:Piwi-like protein 1A n=1 Tax=Enchytraeus coronatus TaxID=208440 RepID=A0AAU7VFF0_9ANNE
MDGRGRGRARGRGRGDQPQQQGAAQPGAAAQPRASEPTQQTRPGPPPQQLQQQQLGAGSGDPRWAQPQQQPVPRYVAPTAVGDQPPSRPGGGGEGVMVPGGNGGGPGRAAHRGGAARPGASVEQLEAGVAGIVMADAMGGRPRRGALMFRAEPRTRPETAADKRGTAGRQVALCTNQFHLQRAQQFHLYQYHVDFNPEVPNTRMRKGMLHTFKELLGPISLFDGTILFLPLRLELDTTEVYTQRISDDEKIRVTIKFTNEIPSTSPMCMQLYNITFKKVLTHIGLQLIGRNYYHPNLAAKIPQHKLEVWPGYETSILQLEVWPGYETSILQFESGPMLSVDVSHKILSMASAYDVMQDCFQQGPRGDVQDRVKARLIGQIVLTRYNNKTYRVDDIDFSRTPASTFEKKDKSLISFVEYYQTAHNFRIQREDQPLLISMPKRRDERAGVKGPICLIPELCTVTGLEEKVRTDFNVMKDLAQHTRLDPNKRVAKYRELRNNIQQNAEAMRDLNNWNIGLSNELVQLQGRQLPPENIHQGDLDFNGGEQADWTKQMRALRMQRLVHLSSWIVVCPQKNGRNAEDLIRALRDVSHGLGLELSNPTALPINNDNTQTYKEALQNAITPTTRMVVCVLPTNRKDRYDALKCLLCCDIPVPSQMILSRTLSKPQMLMSVATKVLIQMNCKMGGEVWHLDVPMGGTMVVGIDTYHDSSQRGRSVAGVAASLNKSLTRYYTSWSFQNTHEELVNGLTASLAKCLQKYKEVNKVLPIKVIVFRDGVGDGQLGMVNDHELPQILQCFARIDPDYKPGLGFVVVKKRISSRFFMRAGNNYSNPPPGTIIDDVATRPEWYDYFVISQSVRQGTVTPTHYNIIHDTTRLQPDHYQRLTYKLCHLYYNWSGTIRVPAPCQYAHKVAFLVGQSLHRNPHESLADKLFFL